MQPLWGNVAALTVTAIYYIWRAYLNARLRKERQLRERVAYMLWVMADRAQARTEVSAG
jgi:hypothetical protein